MILKETVPNYPVHRLYIRMPGISRIQIYAVDSVSGKLGVADKGVHFSLLYSEDIARIGHSVDQSVPARAHMRDKSAVEFRIPKVSKAHITVDHRDAPGRCHVDHATGILRYVTDRG